MPFSFSKKTGFTLTIVSGLAVLLLFTALHGKGQLLATACLNAANLELVRSIAISGTSPYDLTSQVGDQISPQAGASKHATLQGAQLSFAGCSLLHSPNFRVLDREAMVARLMGDYKLSESILRDALSHFPHNQQLEFELGHTLWQTDHKSESIEAWRSVGSASWLITVGNWLLNRGDAETAISAFRAAISVNPQAIDARLRLAAALWATNNLQQAISAYEATLNLFPGNPEACEHLTTLLVQTNKVSLAEDRLAQCLALHPHEVRLRVVAGELAFVNNNLATAIDILQNVLVQEPGNYNADYWLAQIFSETGDHSRAIAYMQAAVALQPRAANWQVRLGDFYTAIGDAERAIASYRVALTLDPGNPWACAGLASLGHPEC